MRYALHKSMPFIALDPAGPDFELSPPEHRLDSSDAKCVEVTHTSNGPPVLGGFGLVKAVGHVDVYVDGGVRHPNCPDLFPTEILRNGNLWQLRHIAWLLQVFKLGLIYILHC